jgi:hypothetical protein
MLQGVFALVLTLEKQATVKVIADQHALYLGEQRLVRWVSASRFVTPLEPVPKVFPCVHCAAQAHAMKAEVSVLRALLETDHDAAVKLTTQAREEVLTLLEAEQHLFVGNSFPGFVAAIDANNDEVLSMTWLLLIDHCFA